MVHAEPYFADIFAVKSSIPEAEKEKSVPHVHRKTRAHEEMCT